MLANLLMLLAIKSEFSGRNVRIDSITERIRVIAKMSPPTAIALSRRLWRATAPLGCWHEKFWE